MSIYKCSYQLADSSTLSGKLLLKDSQRDSISQKIQLLNDNDESSLILLEKPNVNRAVNTQSEELSVLSLDSMFGVSRNPSPPVRELDVSEKANKNSIKYFEPTKKNEAIADWQTGILFISILLIGFANLYSSRRFAQVFQSFFSQRVSEQVLREEKVLYNSVSIFLTITHLLLISLLAFQVFQQIELTNFITEGLTDFLVIIGVLSVLYSAKIVVARILSFIFNVVELYDPYTFTVMLTNNVLGVALIPVLLICYYMDLNAVFLTMYVALPMLFLFFMYRTVRMFLIGYSKGLSYLYIILYLCTLEILPLVVMLKFFIFE